MSPPTPTTILNGPHANHDLIPDSNSNPIANPNPILNLLPTSMGR